MERQLSVGIFRSMAFRLIAAISFCAVSSLGYCADKPIRVALYDHSDGSAKGPKALARVLGDTNFFECKKVTPADVRDGVLDTVDVLIMPGGSGSAQAKNLEESGREKIRAFVKAGGGYVGICAGSYLASSHYDWSLHLLNAKVVDREHWARGTGQVHLTLTDPGKGLMKNKLNDVEVFYGQGPLLAPDEKADLPQFESLASYATEIAKNGAPTGVMIGTTAIARAPYGEGRVFCFSPHCEVTGGPNFMTVNAVLWAAKREELNVPSKFEPAATEANSAQADVE